MAAIKAAFASPQGQAAAADVASFATGGADMLMFDSAGDLSTRRSPPRRTPLIASGARE